MRIRLRLHQPDRVRNCDNAINAFYAISAFNAFSANNAINALQCSAAVVIVGQFFEIGL